MQITIAGKGGSGKTTIAGLLARSLGRRRGSVLAIDGDSNPNLALTLGLSRHTQIPPLPRDLLERYTDQDGKTRVRLSVPVDTVIEKFAIPAPDGVRLLVAAKVDHAGAG